MKKYLSIAALSALSVLVLGSCVRDNGENVVDEVSAPVTFSASLAENSRTGLALKFVPNWTDTPEDNISLFQIYDLDQVTAGTGVKMTVDTENPEIA